MECHFRAYLLACNPIADGKWLRPAASLKQQAAYATSYIRRRIALQLGNWTPKDEYCPTLELDVQSGWTPAAKEFLKAMYQTTPDLKGVDQKVLVQMIQLGEQLQSPRVQKACMVQLAAMEPKDLHWATVQVLLQGIINGSLPDIQLDNSDDTLQDVLWDKINVACCCAPVDAGVRDILEVLFGDLEATLSDPALTAALLEHLAPTALSTLLDVATVASENTVCSLIIQYIAYDNDWVNDWKVYSTMWNLVRFPLLTPTYRLMVLKRSHLPNTYRNRAMASLTLISSGLAPPWSAAAPGNPITTTATEQEFYDAHDHNQQLPHPIGDIPAVWWEPRPASQRTSFTITWHLDLNSIVLAAAKHQAGGSAGITPVSRPNTGSAPFFRGYYWDLVLGVQGQGDDISYGLFIRPWVPKECPACNRKLCQARGIKLQAMALVQPADADDSTGQSQVLLQCVLPRATVSSKQGPQPELQELWGKADFFGIKGPFRLQAWHDAGLVHADGKLHLEAVVEEVL